MHLATHLFVGASLLAKLLLLDCVWSSLPRVLDVLFRALRATHFLSLPECRTRQKVSKKR